MSNRYCYLLASGNEMELNGVPLFYFGITLCMFRTVFPSNIRSSKLYIYLLPYVQF